MKKWEYKFIERTTAGVDKSPEKVIEEMNTAGDEGYRLVQIDLPCTKSGVVMEREIPEAPATQDVLNEISIGASQSRL